MATKEYNKTGGKNIVNNSLVDRKNIILPPLNIKLGLMKQFAKHLIVLETVLDTFAQHFLALAMKRKKQGYLMGLRSERCSGPVFRDYNDNTTTMTVVEARAWEAFSKVVHNFLSNKRADNYIELVEELLLSLQDLGCRMSIKVHYLRSHLSEFPANFGDISEEQRERFHQDVKVMQERYQSRWNCNMMADYCWSLMRDVLYAVHKRLPTKRKFLMP